MLVTILIVVAMTIILVINAIAGQRMGFICYLTHAGAGVIACIVALIVCLTPIKNDIYNKIEHNKSLEYISNKIDIIEERSSEYMDINRAVDDAFNSLSEESLRIMGLSGVDEDDIKEEISTVLKSGDNKQYDATLSEILKDKFIKPVILKVITGLLFIITYLISYIVVIVIGACLNKVINRIKVTKATNKILGMLCGIICGVTYSLVIIVIANVFSVISKVDIGIFSLIS